MLTRKSADVDSAAMINTPFTITFVLHARYENAKLSYEGLGSSLVSWPSSSFLTLTAVYHILKEIS